MSDLSLIVGLWVLSCANPGGYFRARARGLLLMFGFFKVGCMTGVGVGFGVEERLEGGCVGLCLKLMGLLIMEIVGSVGPK